jgi:hypothetical protein
MATQKPTFLSHDELKKLSQDPKNRVYEYAYDAPTARFKAADQKQLIGDIRTAYIKVVSEHKDWDDVKIRTDLKAQNPLWGKFEENHTKTFETITDRNTPEEHMLHLRYMLYLREQQESGNLDAHTANAMVQDYLVSKFKTDKTLAQYKEEMKREQEENKKPSNPKAAKCGHGSKKSKK